MMKVNFLAQEHRREPVKQDPLLGICDPDGELPAYTTTERGADKWCAEIQNNEKKRFQFIAVDKNIISLSPHWQLWKQHKFSALFGIRNIAQQVNLAID